MKSRKPTFIDLFAGAGGLSEGFIRAGYEPVAHVEMDEAASNTLRTRTAYHHLKSTNRIDIYLSYLRGEITRTELYQTIPKELLDSVINLPVGGKYNKVIQERITSQLVNKQVDLIVGGPPCQAYSVVGRSRKDMTGDPRNYLYIHYAKYLDRYSPKMFVFENVIGIKSAGDGRYLRNMEKLFLEKGYEMKLFTIEANNFGVLQNRKRVIILGWRSELQIDVPDLEKINIAESSSVQALLSDLPVIEAGGGKDKFLEYSGRASSYLKTNGIRDGIKILTQHVARPHTLQDKEIYRIAVQKWNTERSRLDYRDLPQRLRTHKNMTSFTDRFKVVAREASYSQTVVAHISKDGHYYIHPDYDQNRSISVREAARIQSFPDDYYFEGVKENANRTAAFKQIGNAVPPLMAFKIADLVKSNL